MPPFIGPQEDPITVFKRAMDSGFDPVKLRALQQTRLDEMQRNRDFQNDSRVEQALQQRERSTPAAQQRDRMMGWDLGTPSFATGATRSDVAGLQDDLASDPYTGQDQQDRTARVMTNLDEAATNARQEIGDSKELTSRRNAFAKFLDAQGAASGKYAADVSPEGVAALDAASRRKQSELGITAAGKAALRGGMPLAAIRPGDDPLEGLSPQEQAIIKGLTNYQVQLPGGSALRTAEWQDRLGRALLLDPTFDQSQYLTRQKMRSDKNFQDNVQALGTVQAHADALHQKGKDLGNFGSLGPLNEVANEFTNWWKKQTGDPTLAGYGLDQTAVGDEIARALKGGVATQAEGEHWRQQLRASLSPQAQDEVHRTIADLVQKRLEEAGQRYDTVMGKPGAFKGYLEETKARAGRTATGGSAGTPAIGERKTFPNGKVGVWDGTGWVAE